MSANQPSQVCCFLSETFGLSLLNLFANFILPLPTVQFVQNVYIESYDPTIEDSYRKTCEIDHRPCTLEILDTAGVEQFTAMRELYIKNGQGFVLVYSVTNENSLQELIDLRDQVIRIKDNANVPMVLVANKVDLESQREVSPDLGVRVANSWGRTPFYETSAKYRSNIDEVFTDLVRQIMRRDSGFGGCVPVPSIRGHSTQGSIDDSNYVISSNQHQKTISNASNYSHNSYSASATPNSLFKLKQRQYSKDSSMNLPRYQQPLSPQQHQYLESQPELSFLSQDPLAHQNSHQQLHKKVSRAFKSPPASKSMPALRKKKVPAKDKDCIIC